MRLFICIILTISGCAFGICLILLATYQSALPGLRWLFLLYPAPLLLGLIQKLRRPTLLVSIATGLFVPFLILLESRFTILNYQTATKIGFAWPHNYSSLQYSWKPKAYLLLDFWLLQRKFSSKNWESFELNRRWPGRLHMSNDLLKRCPIQNLDQSEVQKILGKPTISASRHNYSCKVPIGTIQTVDIYWLAAVNNWEYRLIIEYADGLFLCAYRNHIIHF